jgi:hypothetical protein
MSDVNAVTIMLISFFGGLGSGISAPIALKIYQKWIDKRVDRWLETPKRIKNFIKENNSFNGFETPSQETRIPGQEKEVR